jgi:hypothetical protein
VDINNNVVATIWVELATGRQIEKQCLGPAAKLASRHLLQSAKGNDELTSARKAALLGRLLDRRIAFLEQVL